MQNDLISRSTLIEALTNVEVAFYLEDGQTKDTYDGTTIMDIIQEQPTVYDFEKVVAELEEELKKADEEKVRCISENPLQFDSAKGYATGISNALDIVRKGGLNNETD